LKQPEDGAVVVFEGIVRNRSGGRPTLYLDYEAYEPMALKKMKEIVAEMHQQFAIDRVAMAHRLGRLEIGETSVLIAVSSPHRPAAFEACRYGIDRLKKQVPIWKREYFADGAVWVEGERPEVSTPASTRPIPQTEGSTSPPGTGAVGGSRARFGLTKGPARHDP
jgi:molybdopterin synthase catalytic subunit